jgi:hypothetical protein
MNDCSPPTQVARYVTVTTSSTPRQQRLSARATLQRPTTPTASTKQTLEPPISKRPFSTSPTHQRQSGGDSLEVAVTLESSRPLLGEPVKSEAEKPIEGVEMKSEEDGDLKKEASICEEGKEKFLVEGLNFFSQILIHFPYDLAKALAC